MDHSAVTSLVIERSFYVPPERVYDAWLDPATAERFLFATPGGEMLRVEIDARVGGKYTIVEQRGTEPAAHYGTYLELNRPRRIVFTLSIDEQAAGDRVSLDISPADAGCVAVLRHQLAPQWSSSAGKVEDGWRGILEGLAAILEQSPAGR